MATEIESVLIVDAETGEQTERPMTADELAERATLQAETTARIAQQEARAAARESALAKLADLGLTAEEVAAL
jgi:hypothetical protein